MEAPVGPPAASAKSPVPTLVTDSLKVTSNGVSATFKFHASSSSAAYAGTIDFTYGNAVRMWQGANPNFFAGTSIDT